VTFDFHPQWMLFIMIKRSRRGRGRRGRERERAKERREGERREDIHISGVAVHLCAFILSKLNKMVSSSQVAFFSNTIYFFNYFYFLFYFFIFLPSLNSLSTLLHCPVYKWSCTSFVAFLDKRTAVFMVSFSFLALPSLSLSPSHTLLRQQAAVL
jgi:hypothetical protein